MVKKNDEKEYSGFVVEFEPERSNRLAEWMSAGYDFSDSYSSDDWSLRKKEIFFVISPKLDFGSQTLLGAVFVERMHGTGGTRKPKYKLTRPVLFEGAIGFLELQQAGIDFSGGISNSTGGFGCPWNFGTDWLLQFVCCEQDRQKHYLNFLFSLSAIHNCFEELTSLIAWQNSETRLGWCWTWLV